MNRAEKIKKLLYKTFREPADGSDLGRMDERILCDASTSMRQAVAANQRIYPISKWRKIMRTKTIKLATAAAVVVAALVLTTFDRFSGTAWSVEQTIAAIKELNTLHIEGKAYWGPDSDSELVDFDFWVQFPNEDSKLLKMRFECYKRIVIVQGEKAYVFRPKEKSVNIVDGSDVTELQIWYKGAEFSPWLTGKMLWVLRQFSDDWKQVVQYDPGTGKKQIHVTCSYPSDTSYSIVVDDESKLIETARMWLKGHPCVNAQTFTYNQEAPSDAFKVQVPADYTIDGEEGIEESRALYNRAGQLFVEKKFTEALKLYQQGYEQYGSLNNGRVGADMLTMVGMCYPEIGQFDKMVDTFLKYINEYSHLEGSEEAHYCLGRAYQELGQNEKALEAYEKCILIYEGLHEPDDQYQLKNARERIEKIKAEQDSRPSP
ncbi:tetratricopeptide repeat protein [Planctomycetota bacterium]